jgi:NodT family efflux transporter outer membrane factor (OMF) lipoprotein
MNQLVRPSHTTHKTHAIAFAIVCSLLLVLPACGIPALRQPLPGPGLPPDNGPPDSENSALVGIEEFYNDPALISLIHQSLATNQELKIRNEEVQIAGNEIRSRRGAYLPFVSIGGGAALSKISSFTPEGAGIRDDPFRPGQFLPNPLPNFLLGGPAGLFWQLDVWRQLRNARDAAILRYCSTSEGRNYFVTNLVAEIADNYYGLIALDKRLENLDNIIALQERSLDFAQKMFLGARLTELPVERFRAEVRKNQSEKLIVIQDIIQTENRINFLVGRYPQPVSRLSGPSIDQFIDLTLHALSLGVPSQLLLNRPDIRQAERELAATGIDIKVARADFFPKFFITGGVGYDAFNPKYLLITPEALIYNIAGDIVAPLVNKKAIQAAYMSANARQLQALYHYQRVILDDFTEVINRVNKVENYRRSIEIRKQQVQALQAAVGAATKLWYNARPEVTYIDVLLVQRDLFDARRVLIDTKREQLSAVVNAYQALGGGGYLFPITPPPQPQFHHWKHSRHAPASAVAVTGPVPLPAPAAAAGRASEPPPASAAEMGPTLLPAPPAPAGMRPEPLPAPSVPAEMGPEPLPTSMGGGNGSGTAPKTNGRQG